MNVKKVYFDKNLKNEPVDKKPGINGEPTVFENQINQPVFIFFQILFVV
jgi:hypothetical protein